MTIKRIIAISRPIFWPSTFFAFLLGVVFSHNSVTFLTLFFAFIWSFPYSLWISTINDLSDRETDNLNSFKEGISGIRINENEDKTIKKLAWISLAIVLVPILLTKNIPFIVSSIIALIVPYLYSAYPFRLKEKPPLDSLSNGVFVAFVFISGYLFYSGYKLEQMFIHAVLAFFFAVSAIHIIGALRDYTPDKKVGVKTIVVVWGRKLSALFASLLFFLTYLSVSKFPIEFRLFAIFGVIFSLILTIWPNEKRSMQLGFGLVILFFIFSAFSLMSGSLNAFLGSGLIFD